MTQSNEPTIIEMNRAICEFMGWEFKEDPKFEYMAYFEGRQMWCDNLIGLNKMFLEGFKYHLDWNKLIEVIKKIKGMHLDILKQAFVLEYMKAAGAMNSGWISLDIDKAHKGVYEFLTWYNQQKKNDETNNGQ